MVGSKVANAKSSEPNGLKPIRRGSQNLKRNSWSVHIESEKFEKLLHEVKKTPTTPVSQQEKPLAVTLTLSRSKKGETRVGMES